LLTVAVAAVAVVLVLASSSRPAPRVVESIFQDDQYLLYEPPAIVEKTLDALAALGVDRVRLTVLWSVIAPDPDSTSPPPGFVASDPADYPAANWARYDRVVELARARGIGVDFNFTAPGPLWAMRPHAPDPTTANHYAPSVKAFGEFVAALGRRYSGTYVPPGTQSGPLPRVSYWSIWNEPNQPGWLAPQWRTMQGRRVMDSPRLYREYVDAAFSALLDTGHGTATDTVLVGELAPEGCTTLGSPGCTYAPDIEPIPPMDFVRALYCVDGSYRPIRGALAVALHCPSHGDPQSFVSANPGLFDATGFAHHPYSFFLAPNIQISDPSFVPLADLSRLEGGLDRIFATYGVHRQLPIYVTEYGYETDPPNPFRRVSPRQQSLFLNEAQYIAWKDPRVRSFAQFLLYDSAPDPAYPPGSIGYWSTFQTGLLYLDGAPKPSLNSYRLPIFIPDPVFAPGSPVFVWGMLRLAPNDTVQRAMIQWRPSHGPYRTLSTVTTDDPSGFLTTSIQLPGTGAVRIAWTSRTGATFHSRSVGVRSR